MKSLPIILILMICSMSLLCLFNFSASAVTYLNHDFESSTDSWAKYTGSGTVTSSNGAAHNGTNSLTLTGNVGARRDITNYLWEYEVDFWFQYTEFYPLYLFMAYNSSAGDTCICLYVENTNHYIQYVNVTGSQVTGQSIAVTQDTWHNIHIWANDSIVYWQLDSNPKVGPFECQGTGDVGVNRFQFNYGSAVGYEYLYVDEFVLTDPTVIDTTGGNADLNFYGSWTWLFALLMCFLLSLMCAWNGGMSIDGTIFLGVLSVCMAVMSWQSMLPLWTLIFSAAILIYLIYGRLSH